MKWIAHVIVGVLTWGSLTVTGADTGKPKVRSQFQWKYLSGVVIQDRGRMKPLSTFAEESLLQISGKRSWKGMAAIEVLSGWIFSYETEWVEEPFLKIEFEELKTSLGLEKTRKYFSPKELSSIMQPLSRLESMVDSKESRNERLGYVDKSVQRLRNQYSLLAAIVRGQALRILPNPEGLDQEWFPIDQLSGISALPYSSDKSQLFVSLLKQVSRAFLELDAEGWEQSTRGFEESLRVGLSGGKYPSQASIQRELLYNAVRPFSLAYGFYLAVLVLLIINLISKRNWSFQVGMFALGVGFAIHTYGFVIRTVISGRAPVTNMYESIIWVSWGCVLCSFLVWLFYRNVTIILASIVFAILALIMAGNAPMMFDASIQPLEPVLRSNFWLTTHVLTITLSYAAFAISLCLGNVVLGTYMFRPSAVQWMGDLSLYMYRAIQIGVLLLAAGTILGGVWADYAWGRFWGWDPKEVWALVTLLLYLAVLHGRFAKWLGEFGFVVGTVFSFLAVLMAWYGVNFILGVGLHAYGFGTGGMAWIVGYVAFQIAFIIVAYLRYVKVVRVSS